MAWDSSTKAAAWQRLHKWSYAFYFILFANVILLFVRRLLVFGQHLDEEPAYLLDTYLLLFLYIGIFRRVHGAEHQDQP